MVCTLMIAYIIVAYVLLAVHFLAQLQWMVIWHCDNICTSFKIPYANTQYPNMWVSAILTLYYLIVTIQSVMEVLSTKINNAVCYLGDRRKQALFTSVENIKLRKIK